MHNERPRKQLKVTFDLPHQTTLNDLPQSVIDEVLVKLPIKDAIATSRLSRIWRHRWKSMPDLTFFHERPSFVSQTLLLHTAPLHAFQFISPRSTPSVDCWLVTLASRAADSLHSLDIGFTRQTSKYHLHSAVYSFPNLTRFFFNNCRLTPPHDFMGFKNLQTIQLEKVSFSDASLLNLMISASPFLWSVCLEEVKGKGCVKIRGPSLHALYFRDVEFDDFVLGSAPLLSHAEIRLSTVDFDRRYHGDVEVAMEGEWLGLGPYSLKIYELYGIPEKAPINFDYLTRISLGIDFSDMKSIAGNIYLLRSCPNLVELKIESCILNEYGAEAGENMWDALGNLDLVPNLKTVEIRGIVFEDSELEFVRVMLERAKVLESMVLYFDHQTVRDTYSAMRKLLGFRRASTQARIEFEREESF